MGCFFGCFRVRDDRHPPRLCSQPVSSLHKDPVVSSARNPLSSLLIFEAEDRDELSPKDRNCGEVGASALDVSFHELKAEAKFLKDCGTLPHTPAEIRNNEKLRNPKTQNGDTQSSKYHSWLETASIEKVKQEKQPGLLSTPAKLFEEWENESSSLPHSPDSVNVHNSEKHNSCSAEGGGVKTNFENADIHGDLAQCSNKSVRFACEIDASSYSLNSSSTEVTCQEPKSSGYASDYSVTKPSPYPTPLSLADDMQTPGTVFPSYLHKKYVSPVRTTVENVAQLNKLEEESFSFDDYPAQSEEHKELNVDTSLSSWLPPKQKTHLAVNNRSIVGKVAVDRPILGTVAAHWNADEVVDSPPKWWDGNGIPNSTNKYKEDQKVSWHATPFEERLEKALFEDRLIAERKQFRVTPLGPVNLNEKDECEASSHFEPGLIMTA